MSDENNTPPPSVGEGDDQMIFITGLWLNESRSGNKYMSGGFGFGGRVFIFKNKSKRKESDPDYIMKIAPKQESTDKRGDNEPPF